MTMYREILRLSDEGKMSGREIAATGFEQSAVQ